ncbi:hypothetical protein [Actinomadura atramentaria]|uniref:hypothetical protein n=1 Tax=Actinomadura atramentaria TaxID=1990 RepID=UPI000373124B|nr:hypothetical protein [Actinomadura atramentaria]
MIIGELVFVSDLKDGDWYADENTCGPGAWQQVMDKPRKVGDEIEIAHAADDGESPGIYDSCAMVRRFQRVKVTDLEHGDRYTIEDGDGQPVWDRWSIFDALVRVGDKGELGYVYDLHVPGTPYRDGEVAWVLGLPDYVYRFKAEEN